MTWQVPSILSSLNIIRFAVSSQGLSQLCVQKYLCVTVSFFILSNILVNREWKWRINVYNISKGDIAQYLKDVILGSSEEQWSTNVYFSYSRYLSRKNKTVFIKIWKNNKICLERTFKLFMGSNVNSKCNVHKKAKFTKFMILFNTMFRNFPIYQKLLLNFFFGVPILNVCQLNNEICINF